MNNLTQIVAMFFAQLGLGSAIVLPFFPLKIAGKSFVRFYYGFIVICLAIFSYCLVRLENFSYNYAIVFALAGWIWALSFTKKFTKLEELLMWFFAGFSVLLLYVYTNKYYFHHLNLSTSLAFYLTLFLGMIFLTLSLMNMIFGHWYLVNRSLPIEHLIKTSKAMIIFTYLRIASVAFATYFAYSQMDAETFARLTDWLGHGIFFWARILTGLALPILVAHMTYSSAKIGSNQSATGIMYAGCIFILMGEMLALYLFAITGFVF